MHSTNPLLLALIGTILFTGCLTPNVRYVRPSMDASWQPATKSRGESAIAAKPVATSASAKPAAPATPASSPKRPAPSPSFHTVDEVPEGDSLDFGEVLLPLSAEDSAGAPAVELTGGEGDLEKLVGHYIGTKYRAGGTTESGMDCSGFVWRVYNTLGIADFPRQSAADMMQRGKTVSLDRARMGDLVYFRKRGRIYHVGIFMGGQRFAHSSSTLGVMYSNLDEDYFKAHFAGLRRVIQ